MRELQEWMQRQCYQGKVEPNSTLGDAMEYMQDHWSGLTAFLRVPATR